MLHWLGTQSPTKLRGLMSYKSSLKDWRLRTNNLAIFGSHDVHKIPIYMLWTEHLGKSLGQQSQNILSQPKSIWSWNVSLVKRWNKMCSTQKIIFLLVTLFIWLKQPDKILEKPKPLIQWLLKLFHMIDSRFLHNIFHLRNCVLILKLR